MVTSDSKMAAMLSRAEWRSATIKPGAQCVMTFGIMLTPASHVHSWDTHQSVSRWRRESGRAGEGRREGLLIQWNLTTWAIEKTVGRQPVSDRKAVPLMDDMFFTACLATILYCRYVPLLLQVPYLSEMPSLAKESMPSCWTTLGVLELRPDLSTVLTMD